MDLGPVIFQLMEEKLFHKARAGFQDTIAIMVKNILVSYFFILITLANCNIMFGRYLCGGSGNYVTDAEYKSSIQVITID